MLTFTLHQHHRSFFAVVLLIITLFSLPSYANNFTCEFIVSSEWSSGAIAKLRLTNASNQAAEWREVSVQFPTSGINLQSGWGAEYSGTNPIVIRPTPWSRILQPHQSLEFGMEIAKPAGASLPTPILGGDCADANQAPVAKLKVAAILESLVNLDARESFDPDGDDLTYTWSINGVPYYSGASNYLTFVSLSKGNHTITVTVDDGRLTDTASLSYHMYYPPTFDPVAAFDYTVDNMTLSVDGSASRAIGVIGVRIYSYHWDFGDGTTSYGANASHASHTYAQPGEYTVSLRVYDSNLASTTITKTVTVGEVIINEPPVVSFTCSNRQIIGDNFALGLAVMVHQVVCNNTTTDPEGDDLTFIWSWGDESNTNATDYFHNYQSDGSYTVTLTASDGVNSVTESIQHVAVGNGQPPVVTLSCGANGFTVTCNATALDPDAQNLQYRVKWGNEHLDTPVNVQDSFSYTFADEGEYAVEFYAADGQHLVMAAETVVVSAEVIDPPAQCTYINNDSWGNTFQATIRITNTSASVIDGWTVNWIYSDGSSVLQFWNAAVTGSNPFSASNLSWNAQIQPGQSVEFGIQGGKGSATPQTPSISGSVCGS